MTRRYTSWVNRGELVAPWSRDCRQVRTAMTWPRASRAARFTPSSAETGLFLPEPLAAWSAGLETGTTGSDLSQALAEPLKTTPSPAGADDAEQHHSAGITRCGAGRLRSPRRRRLVSWQPPDRPQRAVLPSTPITLAGLQSWNISTLLAHEAPATTSITIAQELGAPSTSRSPPDRAGGLGVLHTWRITISIRGVASTIRRWGCEGRGLACLQQPVAVLPQRGDAEAMRLVVDTSTGMAGATTRAVGYMQLGAGGRRHQLRGAAPWPPARPPLQGGSAGLIRMRSPPNRRWAEGTSKAFHHQVLEYHAAHLGAGAEEPAGIEASK